MEPEVPPKTHGLVIDWAPSGTVCGVDASPPMIARARQKAIRAGVSVDFRVGVAEDLPFPDRRGRQ